MKKIKLSLLSMFFMALTCISLNTQAASDWTHTAAADGAGAISGAGTGFVFGGPWGAGIAGLVSGALASYAHSGSNPPKGISGENKLPFPDEMWPFDHIGYAHNKMISEWPSLPPGEFPNNSTIRDFIIICFPDQLPTFESLDLSVFKSNATTISELDFSSAAGTINYFQQNELLSQGGLDIINENYDMLINCTDANELTTIMTGIMENIDILQGNSTFPEVEIIKLRLYYSVFYRSGLLNLNNEG